MREQKLNSSLAPLTAALAVVAVLSAAGCSKQSPNAEATTPSPPDVAKTPPPGVDVFKSFDAQNEYDKTTSWGIMNDTRRGYRGQAEWFVPTGSGPLNVIDLAMKGNGSVNVFLAEDSNGLPGNPLESFSNNPSSSFGPDGHLVLVSSAHPALKAGVKYWLCAEPAESGHGCAWGYNNQNLAQGFAIEREQGKWSFTPSTLRNGAFRVNVAP